jgi:lipopolysaccharide transport system ATP-binding protein
MTTVINVENLSKKYVIGHQTEKYYALRDIIMDRFNRTFSKLVNSFKRFDSRSVIHESRNTNNEARTEEFWALKEVSFEVKQGDRVGIIGRNGAGKSTLLKILSRITDPSSGRVSIKGRIASLLEVGTGFHPELTGRENIYLNGAVLGMKRAEIKRKFEEIVDFAKVEKFLDTPVKRYSSGMYVRLAFAVAAHLEPEILVVDEVLAVGDAQFQKKCLGKMEDVSTKEGRAVLFVSHNMGAVASLCTRGIILQNGCLVCDANAQECISAYLSKIPNLNKSKNLAESPRISKYTGEARILDFSIHNINSNSDIINADQPCIVELVFEVLENCVSVGGEFLITDGIQKICLFHSGIRNGLAPIFNKGIHKLICYTEALRLYSGRYHITLALSRPGIPLDYIENAVVIDVELPPRDGSMHDYKKSVGSGNFYIEHRWELE